MKEVFFEFLLSIDKVFTIIVCILSIVSGIWSFISVRKNMKNKQKRIWGATIIIVVSFLVLICTLIRENLTEVPNVVGKNYQDACHVLSECGLNYNLE